MHLAARCVRRCRPQTPMAAVSTDAVPRSSASIGQILGSWLREWKKTFLLSPANEKYLLSPVYTRSIQSSMCQRWLQASLVLKLTFLGILHIKLTGACSKISPLITINFRPYYIVAQILICAIQFLCFYGSVNRTTYSCVAGEWMSLPMHELGVLLLNTRRYKDLSRAWVQLRGAKIQLIPLRTTRCKADVFFFFFLAWYIRLSIRKL